MRRIGLGKEVLSQEIIAKNLRSLKVNVRKLVSVKNSELENWWKMFGAVKNVNWKTGIRNY